MMENHNLGGGQCKSGVGPSFIVAKFDFEHAGRERLHYGSNLATPQPKSWSRSRPMRPGFQLRRAANSKRSAWLVRRQVMDVPRALKLPGNGDLGSLDLRAVPHGLTAYPPKCAL